MRDILFRKQGARADQRLDHRAICFADRAIGFIDVQTGKAFYIEQINAHRVRRFLRI